MYPLENTSVLLHFLYHIVLDHIASIIKYILRVVTEKMHPQMR